MKPVLIQHLIKHNKGKSKATPMTEQDRERHDKVMGKFIFWFVGFLFITGLLIA